MQRAFIVKLDINDNENVDAVAETIAEVVAEEGYTVLSVHAWSANTMNNLAPDIAALEPNVRPPTVDIIRDDYLR